MSPVIEAMEALGSNSALQAKVKINALNVLIELGLDKPLALALILKKHKELKQLINVKDNLCCIIKMPWSLMLEQSDKQFLYDDTTSEQSMINSRVA
jgi:hypothetical protein